jgi:aminobenzoyl-glutamate utilization protein B
MTGTELTIEWDSACAEVILNETLARLLHDKMLEAGPFEVSAEDEAYAKRFIETLSERDKQRAYDNLIHMYGPSFAGEARRIAAKPIANDILPFYLTEAAMPGSTDVGDVSFSVPTGQMGIACFPFGTVEHSWQWVAAGRSETCHKGMLMAGKVLALAGAELITNPQLLEKAASEFRARVAGEYRCAIPGQVKPR